MCLSTISIKTEQGRISVPCGKCPECLQKKRSSWTFRLLAELRASESAYFVTLTYNDETLPPDGELSKRDCQLFIKRLRQQQHKLKGSQIRYYLVGEYGEKSGRPHYHMILFNLKRSLLGKSSEWLDPETGEITELCDFEGAWTKGNIHIGTVNQQSIHYVTKYMLQNQYTEKNQKPFSLMSRRPYLGKAYLTPQVINYHKKNEHNLVTYPGGIQQVIPKIYKDKMYTKVKKLHIGVQSKEEIIKKHQELIKKYGMQEYLKRTTAVDRNNYVQMVKQSKSKKV